MKLILVGSSTGGPNQLKFLFNDLKLQSACVVIAQHMSANFIDSFIKKFNEESVSSVVSAEDKEALKPGNIYICKRNLVLEGSLNISVKFSKERTTFNPNINLLFNSATSFAKTCQIAAVLLTGMGDDGASGLFELYKAGALCLCENEEDSIVYGMPKRAKDLNPNLKPMSLVEIKRELVKFIERESEPC